MLASKITIKLLGIDFVLWTIRSYPSVLNFIDARKLSYFYDKPLAQSNIPELDEIEVTAI